VCSELLTQHAPLFLSASAASAALLFLSASTDSQPGVPMIHPLGSDDGAVHRLTPRLSVLHGPGGLEVPVCTFDGLVTFRRKNRSFGAK
jgi:hypothetical protein